jgi:hypothetical protein
MPLWAWGVGHIAFQGDILTITGIVLSMVIPTGVTSVIWVSIYKGNIPLTLSIILIDTILSPVIVPYFLSLLIGEKVEMDFLGIMQGLVDDCTAITGRNVTKSIFKKGYDEEVEHEIGSLFKNFPRHCRYAKRCYCRTLFKRC